MAGLSDSIRSDFTKDVKELPFIYMEKINWFRKGISFLKAKVFHKKYDSSFRYKIGET